MCDVQRMRLHEDTQHARKFSSGIVLCPDQKKFQAGERAMARGGSSKVWQNVKA